MSVLFKPGAVTITQPDGSKQSLNIIVDQTTEEAVSQINTLKTQSITEMENKKNSVLAEIPDNYTEINNKVNVLKEDLSGVQNGVVNLANGMFQQISIKISTGQIISDSKHTQLNTEPIYVGAGSRIHAYCPSGYYLYILWFSGSDRNSFVRAENRFTNATKLVDAETEYASFCFANTAFSTIPLSDASKCRIYKYIDSIANLRCNVTDIDSALPKMYSSANVTWEANSFWDTQNAIVIQSAYTGNYQASSPIEVKPGDRYNIYIRAGKSTKQNPVVFVNAEYNIISAIDRPSDYEYFDLALFVPDGAKYMLITSYEDTSYTRRVDKVVYATLSPMTRTYFHRLGVNQLSDVKNGGWYQVRSEDLANISDMPSDYGTGGCLLEVMSGEPDLEATTWQRITKGNGDKWERYISFGGAVHEWINVSPQKSSERYSGKKVSVIGDSISSFAGTIPAGNKVYYTGSNAGVTSADQMWWSVFCEATGAAPLIINGWSGSTVASGVRDASVYTPASDRSRCENLGENPDIILIAMGVNDYSYNAPIGDWDGVSALGDDTSTFKRAYAIMLNRIHAKYPNACIACITPWFVQRGTDNGVTYHNGLNLTMADYARAIRDVAGKLNCVVLDGNAIGFNRYNYYPTYCEDSATIPTHPNAKGQKVMGLSIAAQMMDKYAGFLS